MDGPQPNWIDGVMREARLIPVLTIARAADAVPLARALVAAGIRMLEVTLRTPAGAESARLIRQEVPDAIVGLGTVTSPRHIGLACELGVRFAFSPGATPALLAEAARNAPLLSFVPGVQTASELMLALDAGFSTCKFFPAQPAGGLAALKALAGPFPQARFCPTGGVTLESAPDWLAQPNVLALGGSWVASSAMIEAADWAAIERGARAMRAALL